MDITAENFNDYYNEISNNIKSSIFIGFDAEFTGLLTDEKFKYRLFDANNERYNNIKNHIGSIIMTQIGLTMFHYNRNDETYLANSYTFHLKPQLVADINQSFIFQASTLEFLCRHNFDFNKFIYSGLPYLGENEEYKLLKYRNEGTLYENLNRNTNIDDENEIQRLCSEVSKWITQTSDETMYLESQSEMLKYLIHNELQMRFPQLLTSYSLGDENKILVFRNENVKGARQITKDELEVKLLNHLLGFSNIFKLLVEFKKPIVGHNAFMDLLLVHNQFIGPLPSNYSDFKKNINNRLPYIYDTKYISSVMGKKLSFDHIWRSNSLQELYEFFKMDKCKSISINVNDFIVNTKFSDKQTFHEAGWDSYCTGYCFFRLGHWSACALVGTNCRIGGIQLMTSLEQYVNHITIIRGVEPFMNLDGNDPPSQRPKLVLVKSLKKGKIDITHVARTLSGFGSVDVKWYGYRSALVAAASQTTVDKILNKFHSDYYNVTMYNMYLHSHTARLAMWSGALLTGGLLLFFVHRKIKT